MPFFEKEKRKKARKKLERKKQTENDSPCVCVVCFTFSSPLEPLLSFTICRFWVYNRPSKKKFLVPTCFIFGGLPPFSIICYWKSWTEQKSLLSTLLPKNQYLDGDRLQVIPGRGLKFVKKEYRELVIIKLKSAHCCLC